jgi:hypothetical protein
MPENEQLGFMPRLLVDHVSEESRRLAVASTNFNRFDLERPAPRYDEPDD